MLLKKPVYIDIKSTRHALVTTYLHPGPDPVRRVHDALGGLADAGGAGWDVLWAHGFAGQGLVRRRDTTLITTFAGTEGLPIVGEWDSDVSEGGMQVPIVNCQ